MLDFDINFELDLQELDAEFKDFVFINGGGKGETDDDIIDALYETGIINPIVDNSGKIFLAADNNILTL